MKILGFEADVLYTKYVKNYTEFKTRDTSIRKEKRYERIYVMTTHFHAVTLKWKSVTETE